MEVAVAVVQAAVITKKIKSRSKSYGSFLFPSLISSICCFNSPSSESKSLLLTLCFSICSFLKFSFVSSRSHKNSLADISIAPLPLIIICSIPSDVATVTSYFSSSHVWSFQYTGPPFRQSLYRLHILPKNSAPL